MNPRIKKIPIYLLILVSLQLNAHDGKTTKVMEEMIKFHDLLVKESPNNFNVISLRKLLEKGADSKKDTESFKRAIPILEKLGQSKALEEKLNLYAELVEILSPTVGHHDKSGANLFYCPMLKKKWIAKGEEVVNPYDKSMRNCGEKL